MSENRRQILEMLAAGKITADEAERLLVAVEKRATNDSHPEPMTPQKAKYLRVLVDTSKDDNPAKVNIRVPMQLLRGGVRLASLIPQQAHSQLDEALSRHGVPLTLSQIKPENLEELVDQLQDLTVDVDADRDQTKVRIFCE